MKGMGNMQQMMKQMQSIQKKMQEAQEELSRREFEGSAGGGLVKVVLTGSKQVVRVSIQKDAVSSDDVELLEDLVQAAISDALQRVDQVTNDTMGQFTKGLNLPGM